MDFWDHDLVKISCFHSISMHVLVQERKIPLRTSRFHPKKGLCVYFWKIESKKNGSEKDRERGDVNIGIQKRKFVEKLIFRALQALCTTSKCATNIRDLHYPFHYPFFTTFGVVNHHWQTPSFEFMDFPRFLGQPLNFRGRLKISTTLFTTLFHTIEKFRIWTTFWLTTIIARNA